jgi:3-hydroxybutyryl-CoA dehydrogenase
MFLGESRDVSLDLGIRKCEFSPPFRPTQPINSQERDMTIRNVVVVGTGMMGPGIAAVSALAGFPTILVGRSPDRISEGLDHCRELVDQLVSNDLASRSSADRALSLLSGGQELESAVRDADLVIEAIAEDLQAKQQLFTTLEGFIRDDTILASNTSGLSITAIAAPMRRPERAVTSHCWYPGHLMPLVEVVMGEQTSEEAAQTVVEFYRTCGKEPVLVRKDMRGQLANRVFQAVLREAIYIVQEGLATPEDIDTAIGMSFGLRFPVWGPLMHLDAVGLDLALAVQEYVLPGLDNVPEPPDLLREQVARGELGVKTGKGFYDWSEHDINALAANRDEFIIRVLQSWKKEKGE